MRAARSYLVRVVHPHPTTAWLKVIHLPLLLLTSVGRGENHLELARLVYGEICCSVLRDKNIMPDLWDDSPLTLKDLSKQALVFLTWSPKACLPIVMGCVHPGTRRGMFLHRIGSRKTVPPKIFRMVPFGLFHIFFKLNSATNRFKSIHQMYGYIWDVRWNLPSTRASSGVMVAHLTATLYFFVAWAESMVTWSSVWSR